MPGLPKILLLIPHLRDGGAGQVTAQLARGLSRDKYALHLGRIVEAEDAPHRLPPWVTVHSFGAHRVRGGAVSLLRLVRRLRPDVILSGMAHLNFLVLLLRPLFPKTIAVLVRQNGTVSAALESGALPRYSRLLYRVLYRRADRVICQTDAMAEDMVAKLAIPQSRLSVLPNPVDVQQIRDAVAVSRDLWTGPGPHLLAVGRLAPEKGFDLLLPALAAVRDRFPSADLLIAGAGPEEGPLKAQCRALRLDSAVMFTGHIAAPYRYFAGTTLFVLSSRHEGMPNALLEAAAAGLPIVAMPACGGVANLLRGQSGAWLAKEMTAEALAASLLEALQGLRPCGRFPHAFVEQFRMDLAVRAYEDLIDATLHARRQ